MQDSGLGDSIKRFTTLLGINQCSSCKERQEFLNRLIPYKNNKIKMTNSQKEIIESLINQPITKFNCQMLNETRRAVDGYFYGGCFCTGDEMVNFMNEFRQWYKNIK